MAAWESASFRRCSWILARKSRSRLFSPDCFCVTDPLSTLSLRIGAETTQAIARAANSEAAPAYFVAAVSTGYVWRAGSWTMRAYARVDNLFNRHYAGSVIVNESSGRYFEPAPRRNWIGGLGATYTGR